MSDRSAASDCGCEFVCQAGLGKGRPVVCPRREEAYAEAAGAAVQLGSWLARFQNAVDRLGKVEAMQRG